MGTQRDVRELERKRLDNRFSKLFGRYKVATLTPLFTVYLDGNEDVAVEAEWVVGATYIVGTTGTYLLKQGQVPTCFPTKRGAYP